MAATAATNAPYTRQTDDREQETHERHGTDANADSITSVKPVAHGAVLGRIECCCTFKIVCCIKQWCSLNNTHALSGADLALQDTGALAAAEYGRLVVWAHSPLFSGMGADSTAAGRCISDSAPLRPLTRFRF